jgi:HEAT repeat protein
MSLNDVIAALGTVRPEPNYWRGLSRENMPDLARLARDINPILAARAVVVAAHLDPVASGEIAVRACKSPRHQIRIAAACAAIFIDEPKSTDVIRRLLQDRDLGVVKYALRAARQRRPSALKPLIGLIAQNASEPHLQALALEVDASL